VQLFLAGIVGRGRWSVIVDIDGEDGLICRFGFCFLATVRWRRSSELGWLEWARIWHGLAILHNAHTTEKINVGKMGICRTKEEKIKKEKSGKKRWRGSLLSWIGCMFRELVSEDKLFSYYRWVMMPLGSLLGRKYLYEWLNIIRYSFLFWTGSSLMHSC
jgi:hypothetical protein